MVELFALCVLYVVRNKGVQSYIDPYNWHIFFMKLVRYNQHLVITVDTDGLVPSSRGTAEYAPMRFELFMG